MADFYLGIGAPRSGTTWLYANMRAHSDVYLPPVKELRFFGGARTKDEKARQLAKDLARPMEDPRDADFYDRWGRIPDGNPRDYRALFPKTGKVGEISPIYCTLPRPRIQQIKNQFPDRRLRAFFMMRNPLERDYSHVIFAMHRNRNRTSLYDVQEYLDYVNRPNFMARSDYATSMGNWQAVLGDDLAPFYYDDLKTAPRAFFADFCDRLDITADLAAIDERRNNRSGSSGRYVLDLPEKLLHHLIDRHAENVAGMDFLPDHIRQGWQDKIAASRDDLRRLTGRKEDFYLGIGAPRAGTTWLHNNLRRASDLYLPPVKELRFFAGNRSDAQKAAEIAQGRAAPDADPRDAAFLDAWETMPNSALNDYHTLFPQDGKAGEISPIYCTLRPHKIRSVKMLMQNRRVRIFFILRNPLERDLSHIIYMLHSLKERSDTLPEQTYLDFINLPRFIARSHYGAALDNWHKHFRDQVELFYYDDLQADPRGFFTDFCTRMNLQGDVDRIITDPDNAAVSAPEYNITLPAAVHKLLIARHRDAVPQMDFLPAAIRDGWMAQINRAASDYTVT